MNVQKDGILMKTSVTNVTLLVDLVLDLMLINVTVVMLTDTYITELV